MKAEDKDAKVIEPENGLEEATAVEEAEVRPAGREQSTFDHAKTLCSWLIWLVWISTS